MPTKTGKPNTNAIKTGHDTKSTTNSTPGVPTVRGLKTPMPVEINSAPRPGKPSTGGGRGKK
jgi:hypothetical protein